MDIEPAVMNRLRGVCVTTDDDRGLDEAGRDWWPLTLGWALAGDLPARPGIIARPVDAGEVAAVLRICREAVVPVTPMAGRSGVCGGSVPVFGGVSLDLTAMAGIEHVDDTALLVRVLPGTFGDTLADELGTAHGITLGHWPQSIALSTVGGWLACRSAGQYSTRYGKIEDMVVGLEAVLADGTLVVTGGRAPRTAAGPDLTQLFVGSEGTLGVITSATLRAHPLPTSEHRAAWGLPSFAAGLDTCRRILRRGATPAVLRSYDRSESMRSFGIDTSLLLVLDEGDPTTVGASASVVAEECGATPGATSLGPELVERWLAQRNDVSALATLVSAGLVLDTIEVSAKWSVLTRLYDDVLAGLRRLPGMVAASAHQSHAYVDGACLYFTWAISPGDGHEIGGGEADAAYRGAWDMVIGTTLDLGGALSHHHGVGINRGRYMARALGPGASGVLTALKSALDPVGILNPGKLGLPSRWGDAPWP